MRESKKEDRVSAIVPAYNEQKLIANVLRFLVKCPTVDEVICVNDGSTDRTEEVARTVKGVDLISFSRNRGKADAVARGVEAAQGDIVLFVDADLVGLRYEHVVRLVTPLTEEGYAAAVGYYRSSRLDGLFRPLTGERAYFRQDMLRHLGKLQGKGYGLELQLNYLYRDKKVKLVELKKIKHILKYNKQSYDMVARLFLRESVELLAQIRKADNPVEYMARAYFYPFYIKEPDVIRRNVKKLLKSIRELSEQVS